MQIVVDGILTNYRILGDPSKERTLVILHGWGRSQEEWCSTGQTLSKQYRVVTLDLPGFGATAQGQKDFDTYDYAKFTENFLRKLQINNCALLGHSFGGRIAIILTANTNLIDKLILVGTAGIRDRQDKIMNKIAKLLPTKLIIGILRRFPKWHQVIAKTLKIEGYWQSKELKNTFAKVVNQDLMSLLPKIKAPTLIIWGERDRILNPRLGKIYKNQISDSQLRIVWEAKHDPHLEKPEQFTEIVEDFLYD